jgi:hypothetical protein
LLNDVFNAPRAREADASRRARRRPVRKLLTPGGMNARWSLFRFGAGLLAVAGGCHTSATDSVTSTRSSALTSYSIRLPSGVALGAAPIVADGSLLIGDRSKVLDDAGLAAALSNAGGGGVTLGVEARSGRVVSASSVELRARARVEGNVTSGGTITLGTGAVVTGIRQPNATVTPFTTESFTVDFSAPATVNVNLESPPPGAPERVTALAPGRYGSIDIRSRNRVDLRTGEYNVNSLNLEPQTRFVIDDAAGPVIFNVRDSLLFKGAIETASGAHPAFRMAYVGPNAVVLETAFSGTFIAPAASVRLATVPAPKKHVGAFYARNLEVSPDVTVVFRPYFKYQVTRDWEASAAAFGAFSDAAPIAGGEMMAATRTTAYHVSAAGVLTPRTTDLTRKKILLDRSSGRFGVYGARNFQHFRPNGALIASHTITEPGLAQFVPGSERMVLLQDPLQTHEGKLTALKIAQANGSSTTRTTEPMQASASTNTRTFYATATELVAVSATGTQLWRVPVPLRQIKASANGQAVVGVRRRLGSTVVHINPATGAVVGEFVLPAPLWEIEVAPGGRFTLAATQTELFLFDAGQMVRRLALPMATFAKADVNDAGEVVVGGKSAGGATVVHLTGPAGTATFTETGSVDAQAYRPFVLFRPGRADFVVIRKEGLSSYTVSRRL